MVMESPHRVLTVEEARNLPPPSPELIEQRRRALSEMRALGTRIADRRGTPLSDSELDEALRRADEDDWNDPEDHSPLVSPGT